MFAFKVRPLKKYIVVNFPRDTARRRNLIALVAPSTSYKLSVRQERPPYGGILLCEVNEGKTAHQKTYNSQ